ncbi:phosphoenolpyruvate synthase [Niallia endozanthoxylica]|uniref:Rifampicin phosphotransferase n=1 Tax=Niallia endozanthoxylica TaxID=2036016 RepID=A0A5J5HCD7_9BACI|nr:phosphoenolpyruvate synthase [Niallia endozanthoxylica]KAA9018339.1 phosphoenolpyruvate synthase [Niallia endozanthoxylica]
MNAYLLSFREIDHTKLMAVGGKGLNLGELSRIEGIQVPAGFCVTTEAYKKIIGDNKEFSDLLDQLRQLTADDRGQISVISGKIRSLIEKAEIPLDIETEIIRYLSEFGEEHAYAVRSSATAEDLPFASFAGQQDTFLNIIGKEEILQHVRKCWASLFTDRAVMYRIQNGFDHSNVYLSVVLQRMIFPQASGILFTADPVTSNRKVVSIDASFGLGEALVSGIVNGDNYKVQDGRIIEKTVAAKKLAIHALKEGGIEEKEIEWGQQNQQTLTDSQILQLEQVARKIEAYFSCPQDIEWCLSEGVVYIVQSRPITTLFPIPERNDGQNRVYLSFGHLQMMTDAIRPLGISFLEYITEPFPFRKAGGRLFLDVTHDLASPIGRRILLSAIGKHDTLMENAILSLMKRKNFMHSLPRGKRVFSFGAEGLFWKLPIQVINLYRKNDPAIIQDLIRRNEVSIMELQTMIADVSGYKLFTFIKQDLKKLQELLYNPRGLGVIIVGALASDWINKKMETWLGEKNAADTLSQSVLNNVTSEMGLALMELSDIVRPYSEVIEMLQHTSDETFFEDLANLEGGRTIIDVMRRYLEKYGMRCSGEIDITRVRWREQPTALIPMILNNIKNIEPHSSTIKFEQGRREAEQKEQDLLKRLEELPGGKRKAKKTKRMISVLRNFIGYREYPKYAFIRRFDIYKQALMKEAALLVQKGVIREKEDIYYLSFDELHEAVITNRLDDRMIVERKAVYEVYEKLTPPRVMTSEGEVVFGEYHTSRIPPDALAGIPVSSGIIEGRARVMLKMEDTSLEDGDILVTRFTDPSWTPLFVTVKGLVTEVGGLMTHGSVIAREYGLPAVVGVENATKLIKDGQRIRVNGTEGYIELL